MSSFYLAYCVLILVLIIGANSESYYTINAPGVIKPNRKYSVVATLHQGPEPCSIRVSIEGPNYKEFKDVTLQPFEFQVLEFFPKKLKDGNYYLKSEGLTGFNLKNQSDVHVIVSDGPKIYIQTDKAIYRPGELVNFRFVVLDEHTKPLNIESPIRVEILDADKNRVKHFKNISLTHGIFKSNFQLSKYPTLGNWEIKVAIDGSYDYSSSKTINIRNYVLPKFRVYLETPSVILKDDGYIKVIIYGRYTFDKYVEGNATVELWNSYRTLILKSQKLDVQNSASVDFNLKTIDGIATTSVYVKTYLTEKYTGKTEEEEKEINLRWHRYYIDVPDEQIEFEDNKPYSFKVYVKYWTGAMVRDRKTPVTMEHGSKIYESFLDKTGVATFEFDYVADADYIFRYKDAELVYPVIETLPSLMLNNREYYCRLKLVNTKLKLGKTVEIEVSSIRNIPYLMYIMMGHASLIRSEYIKVPPNQKSYTISITPTIEMIPKSFIYVFYVQNGNLRYEEMTLDFPYEFENQISLSAPKQVKPGDEVTITVNAQPKSYVGILAVDLGVYLLDRSYDLYGNGILGDLFEEHSYSPVGSAEYPGVISGLITLTNAHYPYRKLSPPPQIKGEHGSKFRFRKKFPETWIFDNYLINDTETKLTFRIPDTITTWRITAFSNNAITGFGIVDDPTDITIAQTFFISLDLPYAVKRGEILTIPITIFNYSNQTLDTEVVLLNTDKEFYFMESKRQEVEKSSDAQQQKKRVSIAADAGKTVKFLIFPIKSGEINIRAVANSPLYSDAVLQKLKVESEGVPKQQNQDLYLSIPEGEKISTTLKIIDPVDSVPDSEYVTFSVGGHYLVPTVDNFRNLSQMPTGSGELNIIKFAPSVLILQYLKINGKLSKEKDLVEGLKSEIELGYETQLSYRHNNGGYSVYGITSSKEPSTWLTAYVVRYFIKASDFVDIESSITESDLEYLASQQTTEGEFLCTGCLFHQKHEDGCGLTAFVLLAFLENHAFAKKYQQAIENGIEFLTSNLNKVEDTHQLCLMAVVMKPVKLHGSEVIINKLNKLSKEHNGLKWWSAEDNNPANDIEITANAALTLLETPGDHTSILKWLIEQRNANGGFISCHDTIAGLEALVKFSEKYANVDNVSLKVLYSATDEQGNEIIADEFHVDSRNIFEFQRHELPRGIRQIKFNMEGTGAALVQLNQQYNIDKVEGFRHFNIEAEPLLINEAECILSLCFTYLTDTGMTNDSTNMVIMEVNLPSGFRSEAENSLALKNNTLVQNVETKISDSVVVLYLDKLKADIKYCVEIPVEKVNEVLMPKPAAIVMYDIYNITRSNTKFYRL